MTNRETVLGVLRGSLHPLDDDEIAARAGFPQRQTANIICRRLATEGLVFREPGASGKIVNRLAARSSTAAVAPTVAPTFEEEPSGSSRVQREAEGHMLRALSANLGVQLAPRSLRHPSGPRVELDGATPDLSVLIECWAHQGSAKVAQVYKLVNDAVKLHWIAASWTRPRNA